MGILEKKKREKERERERREYLYIVKKCWNKKKEKRETDWWNKSKLVEDREK